MTARGWEGRGRQQGEVSFPDQMSLRELGHMVSCSYQEPHAKESAKLHGKLGTCLSKGVRDFAAVNICQARQLTL